MTSPSAAQAQGHYRDPAVREIAAGLLTQPVLAHAALLGEVLRLVQAENFAGVRGLSRLYRARSHRALAPFLSLSRSRS